MKWKRPDRGTILLSLFICLFLIVGCSVNQKDLYVTQTFEKTEYEDSYQEFVHHTYYKMSDGTWKADLEQEDGSVKSRSYRYRLVLHGRMPNAAVDSNYILLSNTKDITFRQTWMASGFSSNTNDYFKPEKTIFVASWLGNLEDNHPVRDKDSVYLIDTEETENTGNENKIVEAMGLTIAFPENDSWIQNVSYREVSETELEITYWDAIAGADCTLGVYKDGNKEMPDYEYTETWEGGTKSNEMISVKLLPSSDGTQVFGAWRYGEYLFGILGMNETDQVDVAPIAKTALYIIGQLE